MIKLKNLWKIALATMAMSAMLVACDTGSDDGKKEAVADCVSITVEMDKISTAWGGSSLKPAFSILYLTEAHVEAAAGAALDPKAVGSTASPVYQLSAEGNLAVDTPATGTCVPFGLDTGNFYDGVATKITDKDVTLFIKTASINKKQFQQLGEGFEGIEAGKSAVEDTDVELMDLTEYKPYALALVDDASGDLTGFPCSWGGYLVPVTAEATFPTDAEKKAPLIYDYKILSQIRGSLGGDDWNGGKVVNVSGSTLTYEFKCAADTDNLFAVTTIAGWSGDKYCGAEVTVGGAEVSLVKGGENATVKGLEAGKTYVLTVDFSTENVKAKVAAK
jgi:hypothetical protein